MFVVDITNTYTKLISLLETGNILYVPDSKKCGKSCSGAFSLIIYLRLDSVCDQIVHGFIVDKNFFC